MWSILNFGKGLTLRAQNDCRYHVVDYDIMKTPVDLPEDLKVIAIPE